MHFLIKIRQKESCASPAVAGDSMASSGRVTSSNDQLLANLSLAFLAATLNLQPWQPAAQPPCPRADSATTGRWQNFLSLSFFPSQRRRFKGLLCYPGRSMRTCGKGPRIAGRRRRRNRGHLAPLVEMPAVQRYIAAKGVCVHLNVTRRRAMERG